MSLLRSYSRDVPEQHRAYLILTGRCPTCRHTGRCLFGVLYSEGWVLIFTEHASMLTCTYILRRPGDWKHMVGYVSYAL